LSPSLTGSHEENFRQIAAASGGVGVPGGDTGNEHSHYYPAGSAENFRQIAAAIETGLRSTPYYADFY